eukprot:5527995-Prymnesium_polylepis.1
MYSDTRSEAAWVGPSAHGLDQARLPVDDAPHDGGAARPHHALVRHHFSSDRQQRASEECGAAHEDEGTLQCPIARSARPRHLQVQCDAWLLRRQPAAAEYSQRSDDGDARDACAARAAACGAARNRRGGSSLCAAPLRRRPQHRHPFSR